MVLEESGCTRGFQAQTCLDSAVGMLSREGGVLLRVEKAKSGTGLKTAVVWNMAWGLLYVLYPCEPYTFEDEA